MWKHKLIAFALTLITVICSLVTPALAADVNTDKWGNIRPDNYEEVTSLFQDKISIVTTDSEGNSKVIFECEADLLESYSISTFEVGQQNSNLPHPNIVARNVPGLDIVYDYQIPYGCAFLFIDFGPNWQEAVSASGNTNINGRYCYLYYGLFDSSTNSVVVGSSENAVDGLHYTYDSSNPYGSVLDIYGPFALVSYNEESDNLIVCSNTYDNNLAKYYHITITGVIADSNTSFTEFFPRICTFGVDCAETLRFGHDVLFVDYTSWNWLTNWDGSVSEDEIAKSSFWDFITNGWFEDSDDPIVILFSKALQGIAEVVNFVQSIPDLISNLFSFVPPVMADFLLISIGIILVVLILKFALHVLR